MFERYFWLTKPGIIGGNIITATAGFFLASKGDFDWALYLAAIGGLSLVIASGCVINNWLDRGIDAKMKRTQGRALVTGEISAINALTYATFLGILGFGILLAFTNVLTAVVAGIGYFFYVVVYSVWKRRSVYSTVVGSVSGAVPPVVGYTAAANQVDAAALTLFLILVLWQMPHFYAIGIFRRAEYEAAGLPILPVKLGTAEAKRQIPVYIIGFIVACALLTAFEYTSYWFAAATAVLGGWWLYHAVLGFDANDDRQWAKQLFRQSLAVLTLTCIFISIDSVLL